MLDNRHQYFTLRDNLAKMTAEERNPLLRRLAKEDLFFLCWFIFGWSFYNPVINKEDFKDKLNSKGEPTGEVNAPEVQEDLYQHALVCANFPFNFCKIVQEDPNQLFLVARGHLKSLTVTVAQNIRDVLNHPDYSVGVISYNLKIAKAFLKQIKNVLEDTEMLKLLFPKILYKEPRKRAKQWSEQEGICVKRSTNRKEPTFIGFGLVDSQLTGFHCDILSYDDMVNENSVTTEDMIKKTTAMWELSDNLKMVTKQGTQKRYVGTRYGIYDTYADIMERGTPFVIIPATDDGTLTGTPIFLPKSMWEKMKIEQGSHTTYLQNLLNPKGSKERQLNPDDLEHYGKLSMEQIKTQLIRYILVDPANAKNKDSDYTVFMTIGTSETGKIYILDIVRDKLNPTERIDKLFELHRKYTPLRVGYEEIALASDIHHIRKKMSEEMYHFTILQLGGRIKKETRIRESLQPYLEAKKIHIPAELMYTNYEGKDVNLTKDFELEMDSFPVGKHDDMLDALARMVDINLIFPQEEEEYEDDNYVERDKYTGY